MWHPVLSGLLIRSSNGPRAVGEAPASFQFNASIHSVAELERAMHINELPEWGDGGPIHVHVDHQHMGVGGDNTWEPDVIHPEFLVPAKGTFEYDVYLCPLEAGEEPHLKAARILVE